MNLSLGGLFFQSFREHAHLHNITLKYSSHDTTVVKARLESQSFSGWRFVPYKSLSVTWLKSEAVTMLSAEIFHMPVLDSWGSVERAYTQRVRARSGNAMNDAKWKRGRQALNSSFCAYHVSYYKCIYYTFYYKEGQVKASNCYWISLSGNLHSCSLSWTLVLASVWKERGQVEISTPHTHTHTLHPLLHHHIVPSQQFVYSSLSGQQNGHLLSECVLLEAVPTLSLVSHLGSLSHATWEEVSPSIIDYADWVGKPMHMATHR